MKLKSDKDEVTLKDIAEVVGKSVAAVSRALNDYDDISPDTRAYIKQVAQEMGYKPNLLAQRLQKRATDSLGLILPVLSPRNADPFFSELLGGIANEATTQGFDLLVSTCTQGDEENQAYSRLIEGRRVDGIIVAHPRWHDTRISLLTEQQIPFIIVGAVLPELKHLCVTDDVTEGATQIVNHLIAQGHTKIALINTTLDLISSSNFLAGFQKAMLNAGLTINQNWLESCNTTPKDGYQTAQLLFSRVETPTAIVTADDVLALGVIAAAHDQGLEVGHDLAVTGYGDILLAEHSHPPLTTIERPTYTLGQHACRLLINRLRNQSLGPETVLFKPSLVIRQSSDLALWL